MLKIFAAEDNRIDELDRIQASLPNLPEEERAKETQRAFLLTTQLMELT